MIQYPNYLDNIFHKLENNGAKCIIVGGFIRDYFLNKSSKDIDIEVYNIASYKKLEELLQEFGSVNSFGKSFGVCKLCIQDLEIDFTLPRSESKISSGHKGFEVTIDLTLDFTQASSRRDFTINAIGYDVHTKNIVDPFHGLDDLKHKILKAVDTSKFSEDPLRVLRAVQFCARFDLVMNEELFALCKKMLSENILYELPKERIFEEIKKLLLKSSKPSEGFILLKKLGALNYFCELEALHINEWNEVLNRLNALAKMKILNKMTKTVLLLAGVCYQFNQSSTISFISKLTQEKELLRRVLSLTLLELKEEYSNAELFRLATKVNIKEFLLLNKAVYKDKNDVMYKACTQIQMQAEKLNILEKKATPLLRGRDILACEKVESKEFSLILQAAYEAQMDEQFSSYEQALSWLKKYLAI